MANEICKLFPEETKMYITVFPFIEKSRDRVKPVLSRMLQNKPASCPQQFLPQNRIRQFSHIFHVIWRIGKDKVILPPANTQEPEDVHPYRVNAFHIHPGSFPADELHKMMVIFYQVYIPASPGTTFKTDTSRSGKQIKKTDSR